jgi:hypothetical protein
MTFKDNFDYFRGEVAPNSLSTLAPDVKLFLEQGIFVPRHPPGSHVIADMAKYDGVLLSVLADPDLVPRQSGG